MRIKLIQQVFLYLLLLSLIITLGMRYQPLNNNSAANPPVSTAELNTPVAPAYTPIPIIADVQSPATIQSIEQKPELEEAVTEVPVTEEPIHTYKVTAYYLNVRTQPSAESKIIKVVKQGTALEIVASTDNGWLELKGEGYVHGRYAKLIKEEAEIASAPKNVDVEPKVTIQSFKNAVTQQADIKDADAEPSQPTNIVQSDSGLTEAHIAKILEGTALAGHKLEEAILEIEEEYGINAYFTIAVMKLESGNGKSWIARKKNNLFGLNAIDGDKYNKAFSFKTKGDSVRKFGQLLSKNYVGKGLKTIEKVAKKYCPANSKWSSLVKNIMKRDYRKL
ncbi:SH3 domain-containing protein [Paenibacillus prosopidis]|uniref:SH3 domain-containing protein n=2 Tax=Paenibacillus prosopidis TaxID=630520 RepID=A0A368VNY3_9BACL|nr:SH3 domain-containing protein [Paenibacillus prosopidis]